MNLIKLPGTFAVCALPALAQLPTPVASVLWSLTVTMDEVSLVCPWSEAPADAAVSGPWSALMVEGPLDLTLTGILHELLGPLGAAEVPIYSLSTHGTDVILVPEERTGDAIRAMERAGHCVERTASVETAFSLR